MKKRTWERWEANWREIHVAAGMRWRKRLVCLSQACIGRIGLNWLTWLMVKPFEGLTVAQKKKNATPTSASSCSTLHPLPLNKGSIDSAEGNLIQTRLASTACLQDIVRIGIFHRYLPSRHSLRLAFIDEISNFHQIIIIAFHIRNILIYHIFISGVSVWRRLRCVRRRMALVTQRWPTLRSREPRTSFEHSSDSYIFKSSLYQMPIKFRPDRLGVCVYAQRARLTFISLSMTHPTHTLRSFRCSTNTNKRKAILFV